MDPSLNLRPHGVFADEIHVATEHPELGKIQVFAYPGVAVGLVDAAIAVVLEEAKFVYTAPPLPGP